MASALCYAVSDYICMYTSFSLDARDLPRLGTYHAKVFKTNVVLQGRYFRANAQGQDPRQGEGSRQEDVNRMNPNLRSAVLSSS